MEPKLVRKDINYQKRILVMVSVLVLSLFIGGSFALLSSSFESDEVVTFKTGNLNLEVKTTGTLSLEGEVPKNYDEGFKTEDITITLTNTGTLEIGKYEVKLEGDNSTTLEAKYIRYSISEDEGKSYLAAKLLSEDDNIIYTGYNLKDTKVLKVKLWIDEDAGEAILKKIYNGKINVLLYQKRDDTLIDVVKSKLVSNYSGDKKDFLGGLVGVNTNGDLYHEVNSETIREYRYSGPNVNNYIKLNNQNQDELWRIIGIFKDNDTNEEYIKIIRNEVLSENYIPDTYNSNGQNYKIKFSRYLTHWNRFEPSTSSEKNNWATAGLQYFLNTEEDEDGINKGYLSYLSTETKKLLKENVKYYLGSVSYSTDNARTSYIHERDVESCVNGKGNVSSSANFPNAGCNAWNGNDTIWKGTVGVMYPSDYGYSAISQNWDKVFWNDTSESFKQEEINSTTWMYETFADAESKPSWTISPSTNLNIFVIHMYGSYLYYFDSVYYGGDAVRPVLSLKSSVKITSGDGTSTNPYNLTIE